MKPIYKYLPLEFASGLTEKGVIKLGTLNDYKNEDYYGKDIGDKDEGSLTEWTRSNYKNVKQSDLNKIETQIFNIPNGVKGVVIENCLSAVTQRAKNLYVFSASRVFNVELMRMISKDYHTKYDACIKIKNPDKFANTISDVFKDFGKFEALSPCFYISRTQYYGKPLPPPVFIKEPRFQYQEEIRAVWNPINKEKIQSTILEIPELKNYCELFFVDEEERTEEGITKVTKKNFENDVVKLDSSVYEDCIFRNTEISFCAEDFISLNTCEFHNCQWTFSGAAKRTLNFMNSLYNDFGEEGKKIIESTFENMRKN